MQRPGESPGADATPDELRHELAGQIAGELPRDVAVYSIDGPFFFGAVENFQRALEAGQAQSGTVIIRLRWVPFIDITGLQALEDAVAALHARGVRVMLTGANARVRGKLQRAGIVHMVGEANVLPAFADALRVVAPDLRDSRAAG